MSRAVELAKKLDIWSVEMARNQRNIEAFYHAARAEALREAADYADDYSEQCAAQYRTMADLEGR